MRSEGDGSQLYSLPHDTGASAPPGSRRPGTAVFQKTLPHSEEAVLSCEEPHSESCRRLPCSAPAW